MSHEIPNIFTPRVIHNEYSLFVPPQNWNPGNQADAKQGIGRHMKADSDALPGAWAFAP